MNRMRICFVMLLLYGGFASVAAEGLALQPFAQGVHQPVGLVSARDGSGRLYAIEQGGRVVVFSAEGEHLGVFLNVRERITARGWEQGLLGLAFHPEFADNRRFFIYYTARNGDNTLAEGIAETPIQASDALMELLRVPDPASNHNGGQLQFGPDGYLYLGLGDGGSGGDPWNNAQNGESLLGKLLRLDVHQPGAYRIPEDNPFVGKDNTRDEIWATGLRNPWRFSFDRENGDLWVADVGQNEWEEINGNALAQTRGANYGWRVFEGLDCYDDEQNCARMDTLKPLHVYDHNLGCSVTGGYVYRGQRIAFLRGQYLFTDFCSGRLWSLQRADNGQWQRREWMRLRGQTSSFAEDDAGELYTLDHGGRIYRLTAQP